MPRPCLSLALVFAIVCGCDKAPEPEPAQEPAAAEPPPRTEQPEPAAKAPPRTLAPAPDKAGIQWHEPSRWEKLSRRNPMRQATYRIPAAEGDTESGELAVFYFGQGQGGDVEANMQRWVGQFELGEKVEPERSIRSSGKFKQHVIQIAKGTYKSGMPGQPTELKEGYALLGAIVETPRGNYFFKLTGPAKTVAAAKRDAFQMLDSIELEEEKE